MFWVSERFKCWPMLATLDFAIFILSAVRRSECREVNMAAKKLGLDKVATLYRAVRDHGGIIGSIKTLFRVDELKSGTLIGEDKYGNRYYENNTHFVGRNRWVIYAEKVGFNYDGSQVPAEWFGWLHYKTDLPPHKDPSRPKYKWMEDHQQNMTGTDQAYMPYSTTRPKIEPWRPPQ